MDNRDDHYCDLFEHISDICKAVRLCFETASGSPGDADAAASGLDRLRIREDMSAGTFLPTVLVRERFELSGFEYFCLMVGVSSALEGNGQFPAFSDAVSHYPFAESENVYLAMLSERPFQYIFDIEDGCGITRRFNLKNFIFNFLLGNDVSVPGVSFNVFSDEFPMLYGDLYESGVDHISSGAASCIVISGKTGSGRRTLSAQIAGTFGKNTAEVFIGEIKDPGAFAEDLTASCVITNSVPVVIADGDISKAVDLVNLLPDLVPLVFICADQNGERIKPRGRSCRFLKIPPPDKAVRLTAWEYYLDGCDIDAKILAERYKLTVGDVAEVCGRCSPVVTDIKELIGGISSLNSESPICRLVHPMFRLGDLVAPDNIVETLKRIIKTVERLPLLMEEYGFEKLFPYGRGLGVLFHGASGTGKTMSAYILAAELGLDVMRADLSRIEDKYIGETEKRISEIFQKAEENNCLLFFDEADSLFTKRTEVTDSHDRHANAQTAHLLQKMEEYSGIVVLATNLEGNIDPAFRRRLHFTLEFLKPDAAVRGQLWRKFLPDGLPRGEIDFDHLANTFDLTPAEIKWAALSAAVLADGEPLSTGHIITALKYEYEKSGLAFPNISCRNISWEGTE